MDLQLWETPQSTAKSAGLGGGGIKGTNGETNSTFERMYKSNFYIFAGKDS